MDFRKKNKFQKEIWVYYRKHGRDLPWRRTSDSYKILVSEIMLQQTQVERVLKKYPEFLKAFPSFSSLAQATISRVLSVWQGMGYNRRALALRTIANKIVKEYKGKLPKDPEILIMLPGIGKATAASIAAFVYNKPTVFIETNIRRVFIHFFFARKKKVSDDEIFKLAQETVDLKSPREWYFALMDYGSMLSRQVENPNRKSAHYTKQSRFEGSRRQIRGAIIKQLVEHPYLSRQKFLGTTENSQDVGEVLAQLIREGFIKKDRKGYRLL